MEEYLSQFINTRPDMKLRPLFSCMRKHLWIPDEQNWGFFSEDRVAKKLHDEAKFICQTFPRKAQVIAVEHELSFTLNGTRFFGIVDAVLRYPDGTIELVDYKTGMRLPKREQLELYSIPFGNVADTKVRLRYILTGRAYHHVCEVNLEQRKAIKERLSDLVRIIVDDRSFHPVVGSHCDKCGVLTECPYGKRPRKSDRRRIAENLPRLRTLRPKPPNESKYVYLEAVSEVNRRLGVTSSTSSRRKGNGTSFRYRRAQREFSCVRTGKTIPPGQMHFVDHKSNRITEKAFAIEFPEAYRKHKDAWSAKRPAEPRTRKSEAEAQILRPAGRAFNKTCGKYDYKCAVCREKIRKGTKHLANKHGTRLHGRCFKKRFGVSPLELAAEGA